MTDKILTQQTSFITKPNAKLNKKLVNLGEGKGEQKLFTFSHVTF